MEQEVWKPIPIPGYEGWYEASSLGNIRRSKNFLPPRYGRAGQLRKPQARGNHWSSKPRPKIVLIMNYKRYATEFGHLVCMAFHGAPAPGKECNHIDGDPWNNTPNNLEWVSKSENFRHALRTGLIQTVKGEKQWEAKIKEQDVRDIRSSTDRTMILAARYGLSRSQIKNIRARRAWKHVA